MCTTFRDRGGSRRRSVAASPLACVKLFRSKVASPLAFDVTILWGQARTYGADQWWVLLEKKGVDASGGAGANVKVGGQGVRVEPKRAPAAVKKSDAHKIGAASQTQASKGKEAAVPLPKR